MNQVVLVGRLCADPEVVTMEEGRQRGVISIAVNRTFKNSEGIYETDFIRCVLWNNIALNTFEYCHTGDVIGIKGRLQTRNYEDEEKLRICQTDAGAFAFSGAGHTAVRIRPPVRRLSASGYGL